MTLSARDESNLTAACSSQPHQKGENGWLQNAKRFSRRAAPLLEPWLETDPSSVSSKRAEAKGMAETDNQCRQRRAVFQWRADEPEIQSTTTVPRQLATRLLHLKMAVRSGVVRSWSNYSALRLPMRLLDFFHLKSTAVGLGFRWRISTLTCRNTVTFTCRPASHGPRPASMLG
jgi:hypothetical protein